MPGSSTAMPSSTGMPSIPDRASRSFLIMIMPVGGWYAPGPKGGSYQ